MSLSLIDTNNIITVTSIDADGNETTTVNYDYLEEEALVTIPDNPTNGDIIRALFPNIDVSVVGEGDVIDVYSLGIYCQTFDMDWWNAPYEKKV